MFALGSYAPDSPDQVQHLNVGTGLDLPIKELAQLVADAVGYPGAIEWDTTKPDGTPKKLLDVSRIEATGWKACIPLKDGLAGTYDDFLAPGTRL